jgi:hypothetical protein
MKKMIIPVELYIRDLYRVYVECDENTTDDQAAALARQMALCGDVDHTMLAADQEIEYDDVQIAFVDDEAAWTEEEEQEMKAALSEAYAAQEQRKQQEQENSITITATVDGVEREVVLTPMQIYTAHRALQDAYDLEDVENILKERVYQDMKPEVLDYLLSHKSEIAAGYRDRLDDDEHWYNVLESVVTDYILASYKK